MKAQVIKKGILLSYFRGSGKRIFMSVNRDPLFFRFVNRARDLPVRPSTKAFAARNVRFSFVVSLQSAEDCTLFNSG